MTEVGFIRGCDRDLASPALSFCLKKGCGLRDPDSSCPSSPSPTARTARSRQRLQAKTLVSVRPWLGGP